MAIKKCPLNSFSDCKGKECAFFVDLNKSFLADDEGSCAIQVLTIASSMIAKKD